MATRRSRTASSTESSSHRSDRSFVAKRSNMNKHTVLITGSSTGIGRASAKLFADRGWNVVATMRAVSAAGDLAGRDNVFVTRLDVTDPGSIDQAIKTSIEVFGKIDAVINNAGYRQYGLFETIPPKSIQSNFDVNLFGVMNVIRAIVPVFRKQKQGLILNVSSAGGLVGLPSTSIYISTKFALEGFTESLAYELASQNIVVKIIEPGGVISTDFGKRSGQEAAHNTALPDPDRVIHGY